MFRCHHIGASSNGITMSNRHLCRVQLFLLLVVSFCGALFLILLHNWRQTHQIDCSTDVCRQISREVNQHLNHNVSPCHDFAMYTCSGSLIRSSNEHAFDHHDPHDDAYYRTTMQFILDHYHENRSSLKHIQWFNESVHFYQNCNDPEFRDAGRYRSIKKMFDLIGGFPMLSSSWNETNFNYEKSLIQIHQKLKRNFLFNIEIRFGPQGNKFAQVNKDVSYTENSSRWLSAYRQFIRHSLEALIEREYLENDRIIDQQIDQLINFELQLQNISFALSLNVDLELFNFTTFEPSMDWANVIQHMIADVNPFTSQPPTTISIGRDTVRQLNRLLVDKRTFSNYLCWQITRSLAEHSTIQLLQAHELFLKQSEASIASKSLRPLRFEIRFSNDSFTKHEVSGRLSELCSRHTIELFPSTFEHLFRDHFMQSGVQKFNSILNKLGIILEQRLQNSPWADRSLINALYKKLQEIQVESALNSKHRNIHCYQNLTFSNSYTETVVNVLNFNHMNALCSQAKKKDIINIQKMNKGQKWNFDLQNRNTLPPNTLLDAPNFWIMSKFGSIIARYIVNLFKTIYNKNKFHLEEVRQLISPKLLPLFQQQVACYREKVRAQVPLEELALQDREKLLYKYITQSEGVDLAYQMFVRLLTAGHQVRKVSGFDRLNLRQLFFISYVNGYCHYIVGNQYNSLFHHLINFSVQNSLNFASVFNCPTIKPKNKSNNATSDNCSLFN